MRSLFLVALIAISACTSGCSLFGGLRRDLDDNQQQNTPYTSGGQWPEHGFLSDDMPEGGGMYNAVGHSERGPASVGSNSASNSPYGSSSWAPQGQNGNVPSYSNSPNVAPPTKRIYKNGDRATRADFVDDSQNEGSLWASDGQTNYYFTKNKIRGVGDIITVKMENPFIKDIGAEIQRTLNPDEKSAELQSAQLRAASGAPAAAPAAPAGTDPSAQAAVSPTGGDRAPASASGSVPNVTDRDIDVSKSIEVKDGDPVMAEIVERYPNGNYKIRGSKKIMYKNGPPRLVTVMAVARGADIGEDDTINSGKLYEYRLEAFR